MSASLPNRFPAPNAANVERKDWVHRRSGGLRLHKTAAVAAVLTVVLLLLVATLFVLQKSEKEPTVAETEGHGILAGLPMPDQDDPYAIIEARNGEFPTTLAGLLADGATVSPGGGSPVGAMLPLFQDAEASALVVTERDMGLSMYGAILIEKTSVPETHPPLPRGWEELFLIPEILSTDLEGVLELRAINVTAPLYFSYGEGALYMTDSLYDMVRIQTVRGGSLRGIGPLRKESGAGGSARIADGGILAGLATDAGDGQITRDPTKIVTLDLSWTTAPSDGRSLADNRPSGDIAWRVQGLEGIVSPVFLSSLSSYNWSQDDLFIPDPLIASLGVNLPAPGRNRRDLPQPLKFAAGYLEGMKLKQSDVSHLLTGPAILSLGGRTQILWYELPGLALDLPRRGESAAKLIERFWSDLFSGIKPKPLDGFPLGGATDFPFSLMAAGGDARSIIGLTSPSVDQNAHLKELAAREESAIGWLYLDFPRLSSSITDMPYMSELLSQEEGTLLEEEGTDPIHGALRNLGTIFATWLTPNEGRAVWFR